LSVSKLERSLTQYTSISHYTGKIFECSLYFIALGIILSILLCIVEIMEWFSTEESITKPEYFAPRDLGFVKLAIVVFSSRIYNWMKSVGVK